MEPLLSNRGSGEKNEMVCWGEREKNTSEFENQEREAFEGNRQSGQVSLYGD